MGAKKIIKTDLCVLAGAMAMAFAMAPETQANFRQAVLSFTPGDDIKPRVQSNISELKAGTRYRTGPGEMREVLLPDGTVLSLGVNSEVEVEDYAYSRERGEGHLVVRIVAGLVRVVGGSINNSAPIQVWTPTAELVLDNAAATISVSRGDGRTRASLLYGKSLSMSSGGSTQMLVKPGFELVSRERRAAPEGPSMQDAQVALADMAALETVQLSKIDDSGGSDSYTGNRDDEGSRANAIATEEQGEGTLADNTNNDTGNDSQDTETPVQPEPPVVDTDPPERPTQTAGGAAGDGFGPSSGGDVSRIDTKQPSQANGDVRLLAQTHDNGVLRPTLPFDDENRFTEPTRARGHTSNRLFNSRTAFTQAFQDGEGPELVADNASAPTDDPARLNYIFSLDGSTLTLSLDSRTLQSEGTHGLNGGLDSYDVNAPFLLIGVEVPRSGELTNGSIINSTVPEGGNGSVFSDATSYQLLQAGFVVADEVTLIEGRGIEFNNIERQPDNFLLLEANPAVVDRRFRDDLKSTFVPGDSGVNDPVGFVNAIGIPVKFNRFGSGPALESTDQVDAIAQIVLNGIESEGVTAGDIKGVNEPGYADYVAKVQPILTSLDALGANPDFGLSSFQINSVKRAIIGLDIIFGTESDLDPTIDIAALGALALSAGSVSDPIAFILGLGVENNIDFTLDDVNQLAAVIVGAGVQPAEVLTDEQLSAFAFIDNNDIDEFTPGERSTILAMVNQVLEISEDPNPAERFLFATGDVDGRLGPDGEMSSALRAFSVDRFFLSAGLENYSDKGTGAGVASGIRAFARNETALGLAVADAGLLVINNGADDTGALLHADFGLDGEGAAQQSTISVTIGGLAYKIAECASCGIVRSVEVETDGRTIGSSHGAIGGVDDATVAFTSPLRSTSAGGGNPALNREGYAGYLVLENYDPEPQDPAEAPLSGGTERPVGNADASQRYAYLRLATATGSSLTGDVAVGSRGNLGLQGWVAGLGERESGGGLQIVQLDSGDSAGNFTLQTNAASNRVSADVTFAGDEPAMRLGGLTDADSIGASAFVDDDRFAARTVDGALRDAALVSGDLVKAGLPADMQAAIPEYQYLKWGFFFGDTVNSSQVREHVHLASWVAGVPDAGDLPTEGIATYAGHAIGNVFTNGASYTAVGTYDNTWDFAARTGTVSMDFDNTVYEGNTAVVGDTVGFQGRIEANNRVGGVYGNFAGPRVANGSDPAVPGAVAGRFSIQETQGDVYRASGTFGAEKVPNP